MSCVGAVWVVTPLGQVTGHGCAPCGCCVKFRLPALPAAPYPSGEYEKELNDGAVGAALGVALDHILGNGSM